MSVIEPKTNYCAVLVKPRKSRFAHCINACGNKFFFQYAFLMLKSFSNYAKKKICTTCDNLNHRIFKRFLNSISRFILENLKTYHFNCYWRTLIFWIQYVFSMDTWTVYKCMCENKCEKCRLQSVPCIWIGVDTPVSM